MSMEFMAAFLLLLPLLLIFLTFLAGSPSGSSGKFPRSYPIIGSYFALASNSKRIIQWTSDLIQLSPTASYVLRRPLGHRQVYTGNPATVQHILKNQFSSYHKGDLFHTTFKEILGDGIFNIDGDSWKFQRQVLYYRCKFAV